MTEKRERLMADFETLQITSADGIAHIELNRPKKMNSMTRAFWRELPVAVHQIEQDVENRVIVISAQGKHFCSGMDLEVFQTIGGKKGVTPSRASADLRELILELQDTATALEQIRLPVIAAVQGACIGGALAFLTACDMRYCSSDAFFSIEEINIGMTCDVGTLQRLPHILSDTHLREWVYTGSKLSAEQAKSWGLVSNVFTDQQKMLDEVMKIAANIATKSPLALHGCKQSMNYNRDHTIAAGLEQIATWNAGMLDSGDILKAIQARKEKTVAEFAALESPRKR